MNKLYFVTTNGFKKDEAVKLFCSYPEIAFSVIENHITEIMDFDLKVIVRDKLLKAYQILGLPCAVEHGALHIDYLNGLPGGISKVVWDNLDDKICLLLPDDSLARRATAKSVVGYCDGKKIHMFEGETSGSISSSGRGDRKFQWDPIFIPDGETQTYAELDIDRKLQYSQAMKAWKQLASFLGK